MKTLFRSLPCEMLKGKIPALQADEAKCQLKNNAERIDKYTLAIEYDALSKQEQHLGHRLI